MSVAAGLRADGRGLGIGSTWALLALFVAACGQQSAPRSSPSSPRIGLHESSQDWPQLAGVVLRSIDWTRVCIDGPGCGVVAVDSVIRRTVVGLSPYESSDVVAAISAGQLPRGPVRFVLTARGAPKPDADAGMTIVVFDSATGESSTPPMDIVVELLRPRHDYVYVRVHARRRVHGWVIDSLLYSES